MSTGAARCNASSDVRAGAGESAARLTLCGRDPGTMVTPRVLVPQFGTGPSQI